MSNRRRREMAVINAALEWHRTFQYDVAWDVDARLRASETLHHAVGEYEELPMRPVDRAVTGTRDTSAEAAASLANIAGDALKVFDTIFLGGGLTCDQVEVKLNRSHQSISARVNDLMSKGWIMDSGLRRLTRSGRKATVWRPTPAALEQLKGNP